MFFSPLPAEKSIQIVDKENDKANNYADILFIIARCQRPKNYQNNIVCGIAERIIRTATKLEINGDKACCDGNCAEHDIGCVQSGQDEIEHGGDDQSGNK